MVPVTPATFTMSVTPFAGDGAIDEASLRAHLRFLAAGGVGVYLCSQGSGEGDLLSLDERVRVYEIGVDEIGGAVPVYAAGIGLAHSTDRVVELARGACRAGVDGVYVLGPRPGALAPRPAEIEGYYREVLEAVDRPVVLSNNSSLAGYSFSVDLIERLIADYEHVREVLIADSVGPLVDQVSRLVASVGDRVAVRVGMSNQSLLAHALGADGILNFEGNIAPRLTESVWTALRAGDANAASAHFARFMKLNVLCSRFGNPRVIKDALRILGGHGGHLRKPYLPLTDPECAELRRGLDDLAIAATEPYG